MLPVSFRYRWLAGLLAAVLLTAVLLAMPVHQALAAGPDGEPAQQAPTPTLAPLPTATGTPEGVVAFVTNEYDQINVRSGPGRDYPPVGVLLAGQKVNIKGRSPGGDWVLIVYPGIEGSVAWVYSYLLDIPVGSFLAIVEPPAPPTPAVTITIDPTLAAEYVVTREPTRLPTFTPPPPLVIPTLPGEVVDTGAPGGMPMGMVIVVLASLGIFLGFISLLRR